MNIYLLAFLLASLDTYLCYKKFIINRNNSKPFLLLIFLISFYLIIVILELLKNLSKIIHFYFPLMLPVKGFFPL